MVDLKVVKENTHEAWLTLRDPEGWWDVGVKFDGCVHLRQHWNTPNGEGDSDYIHICDVDEMIQMLQKIKQEAVSHFQNEYWSRPSAEKTG